MAAPSYTNAELDELFKFFAAAGSRSATGNGDILMESIPDGLEPVLKRLSQHEPSTPQRSSTVPSLFSQKNTNNEDTVMNDCQNDDGGDSSSESIGDFSCADEKKYSFEYKYHIHKLYRTDEWVKKLQETLEASRNQYKPLAEQAVFTHAQDDQEAESPNGKDDGGAIFKMPAVPTPRRGSIISIGRPRANSVVNSIGAAFRPQSPPPSPSPSNPRFPSDIQRQDVRALKKRCVGRRKSMSRLKNQEEEEGAQPGIGDWVYNAAISSAERPAFASFATFPPPPAPSPTVNFADTKWAMMGTTNLQTPLQGYEGCATESSTILGVPMLAPFNPDTVRHKLVARRRAMMLLADEGCEAIERYSNNKRAYVY